MWVRKGFTEKVAIRRRCEQGEGMSTVNMGLEKSIRQGNSEIEVLEMEAQLRCAESVAGVRKAGEVIKSEVREVTWRWWAC